MIKYCQNCGKENDDKSTFCRGCGERLAGLHNINTENNDTVDKNKEKILIGVVVVLVIAIAIVGAFVFMSFNDNNEDNEFSPSTSTNLNTNDNTATVTSSSIPLSKVNGLAVALDRKAQSQDLTLISSVEYEGVTFTKPQCLYIFTKAIDMKSRGENGNIDFGSFSPPDDPLNSVNAVYFTKNEYVDMLKEHLNGWILMVKLLITQVSLLLEVLM